MQKLLGSWRDLNPGPLALESSAIPIELSRLDDRTSDFNQIFINQLIGRVVSIPACHGGDRGSVLFLKNVIIT